MSRIDDIRKKLSRYGLTGTRLENPTDEDVLYLIARLERYEQSLSKLPCECEVEIGEHGVYPVELCDRCKILEESE